MKETDFYLQIAEKFITEIGAHLAQEYQFSYSIGSKSLRLMVSEIEKKLGAPSAFNGKYIPDLQLDILLGVKTPEAKINLILFEVKHARNMTLANYSQLIGYLQVARHIQYGTLILVVKDPSSSQLSNDFSDIINMKNLVMEWETLISNGVVSRHSFSVGLCTFVHNNGFDWIRPDYEKCIKNFEDLASKFS